MNHQASLHRRGPHRSRADRRALRPAPSRVLADDDQPHPDLGPVRARLRHPVRLRRPPVLRTVGVLRHGRHVRRLSSDPGQLSLCARVDRHRRLGRRNRRLSRRPDRAQAHRHLFRDDHRRDRGGVLLRRVQSAVGLHRRRERSARRADSRASTSASPRSISTATGRSMCFWRSGISSVS